MATADQKPDTSTSDFNSQALALAEQLGRIAGSLEGTAETWLNRVSLTDQLTRVRDGASQLLNTLAGGAASGRKAAQASTEAATQAVGNAANTAARAVGAARKAATDATKAATDAMTAAARKVSGAGKKGRKAARSPKAARRAGGAQDLAHAPGKRHRKPSPSVHGAKKSESRIPKMRTAAEVRRRRKGYA